MVHYQEGILDNMSPDIVEKFFASAESADVLKLNENIVSDWKITNIGDKPDNRMFMASIPSPYGGRTHRAISERTINEIGKIDENANKFVIDNDQIQFFNLKVISI